MFLGSSFNIDNFHVEYIDSTKAMLDIIPLLNGCRAITLDLEFDRNRYRYGFTMCLIQIEAKERIFLIDPIMIGVENMKPLWAIFENPAILKVMHSPNEDITLLKLCGCKPCNIGDTEMAARLLEQKQVSLGTLLTENLGIVLDKGQQTSNWTTRPLAMQQLVYAAYDVLHLAKLYDNLRTKVSEIGRVEWLDDLNKGLERIEYTPDAEPHRNLPDTARLSPFELHLTKAMYEWRESLAKRWNMPPANIMANRQVVYWANNHDFTLEEWTAARGMIGRIKDEKNYYYIKNMLSRAATEAKTQEMPTDWQRTKRGTYTRTREEAEFLKEKLSELRAYLRTTHGDMSGALMLSTTQCEGIIAGAGFGTLRPFAQPYLYEGAAAIGLDAERFNL